MWKDQLRIILNKKSFNHWLDEVDTPIKPSIVLRNIIVQRNKSTTNICRQILYYKAHKELDKMIFLTIQVSQPFIVCINITLNPSFYAIIFINLYKSSINHADLLINLNYNLTTWSGLSSRFLLWFSSIRK